MPKSIVYLKKSLLSFLKLIQSKNKILSTSLAAIFFFSIGFLLLPTITTTNWLSKKQTPPHFRPNPASKKAPFLKTQIEAAVDGNLHFSSHYRSYTTAGLQVLSTNTDPDLKLVNTGLTGTATFEVFPVSKAELLNYLVYEQVNTDTWGQELRKKYHLDTTHLANGTQIEVALHDPSRETQQLNLELPISGSGIWYVKGGFGDKVIESMVIRSSLAGLVHLGDNQNIFWVQNAQYLPVENATVTLYNLENTQKILHSQGTDQNGLAVNAVDSAIDIAVAETENDLTLIPVNLTNLSHRAGSQYHYSSFNTRKPRTESFLFTDKFIYKPGDTVNFKAIIRQDDDKDYSIQQLPYSVQLRLGDQIFWQKMITTSELGTLDGSIPLPDDVDVGYYILEIEHNGNHVDSQGIQIAQYRKPSTTLSMSSNKLMYQPQEEIIIDITGNMFLGQPLRNKQVKYKIYQSQANVKGDYDQVSYAQVLERYDGNTDPIDQGDVTLDDQGQAQLHLTAQNQTGQRQYWTVHVQYLDGSFVTATQALRVLVNPGDFVIESRDMDQTPVMNKQISIPFQLSPTIPQAVINNIGLTASVKYGQNEPDHILAENIQITSDNQGYFSINVTPVDDSRHVIKIETVDTKGNYILGEKSIYVQPKESARSEEIFTLTKNKDHYRSGETAWIELETKPDVKSAFVSLALGYSREYRVVPVQNGKASISFGIDEKYQPNIYVQTSSFWQNELQQKTVNIPVNTDNKEVTITITPDKNEYGPAETATFEILAQDKTGNPVQTDLAFWLFDKALLELKSVKYKGIFKDFWSNAGFTTPTHHSFQGIVSQGAEGGGGCFTGDTLITMADGTQKPIHQVSKGDQVLTFKSIDSLELVPAKVTDAYSVNVPGYLIINHHLRVTPEHKMLINRTWKPIGEAVVGDYLLNQHGDTVEIQSIEWIQDKTQVFNLHIDSYHTFIANNIYVHNQKGDIRTTFKDVAYWNPHIQTDQSGRARITVPLPDNLTTWVGAAVSANHVTQVGEGETEFIVTKDIVVTPLAPQFLRTGDIVSLGSLVQNFSDQKKSFDVTAHFNEQPLQTTQNQVEVVSNDLEKIQWGTKVSQVKREVPLTVRITNAQTNQIDEATITIPTYPYGSWISTDASINGDTTFPLTIHPNPDQSAYVNPISKSLVVELYPTEFPQLQEVIAEFIEPHYYDVNNSAAALFGAALIHQYGPSAGLTYSGDPNQVVAKAIQGLKDNAKDGVWKNYRGQIDYSSTRFAIDALVFADEAGLAVDRNMINQAIETIAQTHPSAWNDSIEKQYILSLKPEYRTQATSIDPSQTQDPTQIAKILSATAHTSVPDWNQLITKAQHNPNQYVWFFDEDNQYPNWTDITKPTSWAVRSLSSASNDLNPEQLSKSLSYLYRTEDHSTESLVNLAVATIEYYHLTNQLNRDLSYQVTLANQILSVGQISDQTVEPITISVDEEKIQSGDLIVSQSGKGTLYGHIRFKQFYSNKELQPIEQGLSITRSYKSTKKEDEVVLPGDLILVEFHISGLGIGEQQIKITDYLPSGLVALDETLNNDTFNDYSNYDDKTKRFNQKLTDQGVEMVFDRMLANDGLYQYPARVVAKGIFDAPPAEITLVNQPEIYARSGTNQLVVDGENVLPSSANNMQIGTPSTDLPRIVATLKPLMVDYLFHWKFLAIGGTIISAGIVLGLGYIIRQSSSQTDSE